MINVLHLHHLPVGVPEFAPAFRSLPPVRPAVRLVGNSSLQQRQRLRRCWCRVPLRSRSKGSSRKIRLISPTSLLGRPRAPILSPIGPRPPGQRRSSLCLQQFDEVGRIPVLQRIRTRPQLQRLGNIDVPSTSMSFLLQQLRRRPLPRRLHLWLAKQLRVILSPIVKRTSSRH